MIKERDDTCIPTVGGTTSRVRTLGSGRDPRDPTRQRNSHQRVLSAPFLRRRGFRLRALGARSTWGQAGPVARRRRRRAHNTHPVLSARCSGRIGPVLWCSAPTVRQHQPVCGYEVVYIHRYKWERTESTRRRSGKEFATSVLPLSQNTCSFEKKFRHIIISGK